MRWSEAQDNHLRELHAAGLSCSTIARMIGGITRNAVIGRIHRLGLATRVAGRRSGVANRLYGKMGLKAKGKDTARLKAKPFPVAPKLPVLPLPPASDYDRARVSFVELDQDACKWPVADPQEAGHDKPLFCGKRRHHGLPYCDVHSRRAFQPPQPRVREIRVRERELA